MRNGQKYIAITGGAGFIGSNLAKALNELGYENLIIIDRSEENIRRNLRDIAHASLLAPEQFLDALNKNSLGELEAICHFGAITDTRAKDKDLLFKNNVEYSKALFDYCIKSGSRLIYASSAATYGDGLRGFRDADRNLAPLNPYGESKHLFDEMVRDSAQKPPQWVGFKIFNAYGPRERHKGREASMVMQAYDQIKNTGKVRLFKSYRERYEDGGQKRDFVYVKDIIKIALFFLLEAKEKSGIFNAGTGKARTFADLVRAAFSALGKDPKIEYIDMPEDLRVQYQYFTEADMSSLRTAGYNERFYSLEEGVADYVRNYLEKE